MAKYSRYVPYVLFVFDWLNLLFLPYTAHVLVFPYELRVRLTTTLYCWNWIIGTGWNWIIGNNRVRCSPDWSVYRCIERYCMTPRQRDDDNNLSVGNRNHLKLGIEPESWLQSHELGF